MKKILTNLLIVSIILSSCSTQKLQRILVKTPKIEYKNIPGYKDFSDFKKDAIYAVELIRESYPRIYQKNPDFNKQADEIILKSSSIKNEKDFDILLKYFITLLNDGHSNYYFDFKKYDSSRYAIFLIKEKDNWVIGNIDKEIDSLVIGTKIVSINNLPIKQIEEKILAFESGENKHWKFNEFLSNKHFLSPSYWEAIGVSNPNDRKLNFKVSKPDTLIQFNLEAKNENQIKGYQVKTAIPKYRFALKQNNGFYDSISKKDNFAYLQMNKCLDIVSVKSEIGSYSNFITRPLVMSLFIPKDIKKVDFGKYLQSFFKKINEQNIENLIIDLSYNTGGDFRLGKQLIWYLTDKKPKGFTEYIHNSEFYKKTVKNDYKKYNNLYKTKYEKDLPHGETKITNELIKETFFDDITNEKSLFFVDNSMPKFKGKVYLIISPETFSAGQVLATTLADNGIATVIGRPLGNKPSTQTGGSAFKLPNTKKIISMSYFYMERPNQTKNNEDSLYPEIEIHNSFDDFMKGENKAIEYILNDIKKK